MSNDKNYKVILVGDCRVGKTSYLQYIIHDKINGNQNIPPTIGVQYAPTTVRVRGQNVKINIWDTSGAEKYKSITSSYYRKCQGAIIIFDLTNEQSFQNLQGWLRQIQKRSNQKMVKIVIGNKLDLVQSGQKERKVSQKDLVQFCVRHSLTFKYASALTGANVIQSFNDIVQKIYDEYQVNNTIQEMGSISWENNPDMSFLPQKKVAIQHPQDSSSCPRCC